MSQPFQLNGPSGWGWANYARGATFGPRQMMDFEFVWIVEGDAEYHLDGKIHRADEEAIVLCPPGVTDFFRWDPNRRTRHAFCHFDVFSTPDDLPPVKQWPVVADRVEGDLLVPLFQHLLSWADNTNHAIAQQTLGLMLRIFITGQRATLELPMDIPPDPVDRAITFVHQTLESDPSTPISLDDLAAAACVTSEHLCRLFKRSRDLSPMESVRLARLDRAAVLLSRSNFSIHQIATMCGFASQFHFSRRFKAAFGASPSDIRHRVQGGGTPPLPKLLRSTHLNRPKKQR